MDLAARIAGLYKRARDGRLTEADVLPVSDMVYLDNASFVERVFRDKAEFDRALGAFGQTYDVFRIFTENEVVLDVGAHWGYSAIAMRHQGCRARILSVEAMPLNRPALERLATLDVRYGFMNVAASDRKGQVRFYIPAVNRVPNTGLATTGGTLKDHFADYLARLAKSEDASVALVILDIPTDTLDSMAGSLPVAAIKIDVEGHEGAVLRGARQILSDLKPFIMIEGANTRADVVSELSGHGYFHYERIDGVLTEKDSPSTHTDGFWLHPAHMERYRSLLQSTPPMK